MTHCSTDLTGDGGLTPRQRKAVALMAAGTTVTETARQLGIDRSTLFRWRSTVPEFSLSLEKALRQQEVEATDLLRRAYGGAVVRLQELLHCGNPSVELGAGQALLRGWERARERRMAEEDMATLRNQIAELESRLARHPSAWPEKRGDGQKTACLR